MMSGRLSRPHCGASLRYSILTPHVPARCPKCQRNLGTCTAQRPPTAALPGASKRSAVLLVVALGLFALGLGIAAVGPFSKLIDRLRWVRGTC